MIILAKPLAASFAGSALDPRARILLPHATDHRKLVLAGSNYLPINIGGRWFFVDQDIEIDMAADLDTGALQAAKDYCVYACYNGGSLVFLASLNTTAPAGYTADNSLKIGGGHTLCVAVGVIAGHALTGYLATDLLPASIWDLRHRPAGIAGAAGMVYSDKLNLWVDIYLQSGTGVSTASAYGAAITDTRVWMDHVDDLAAVGKTLLDDSEFQVFVDGSNEKTNIVGSADPVTTGGHVDTAGRRMISAIGCEDCCGVMWQWLRDQTYRFDGAANHTHQVTVSGDPETVASGNPSADVAPGWNWYALPGNKGSLYRQGTYGDAKLLAGGSWSYGANCGSRARLAYHWRWFAYANIGGRGRAAAR
ncbi:MAG: hypothetical protein P1P89_13785 [Desulfobacterales bacterium]|nr:hypothetical protein [Desulfobacterales bacterium]